MSLTKELFTPFKDPEREFRSSRKLFRTLSLDELRSPKFNLIFDLEENFEEEVTETMAETMEEYISKTRADYESGIDRPKIDDKDHLELKCQFLKELRDNTFSGSDHKDANEHIKKVLEILDLFHIPNITQDQVMLRVFPMSLTGAATQVNNLRREIKKVNEKVYVAQVRCELCKGPYYTKDCPLKEEGKTLEEAYYTQFSVPFQQGGKHRAATLGFYQRNNAKPSYQEQRQLMEESLSKFISESAKIYEENFNLIKEIRASKDAAIRNQRASIKTLEIQIGQISKEKDPASFTLPSDINNICFENALADLGASVSVMPLSTYLNLGDKKIIFKSVKPASSLIKSVYMLSLIERMKLDLEARLMGETWVLNRSLDPLYGDYIELNDLNVSLELRRDQVDDLMPTVEEGEWKILLATKQDIRDVIFRELFYKASCVEARRFDGLIAIHNGNDNVTYQME
nr:hypothetical protein [Tanacetum cinerariifolium]GEX34755.1 hypothetical protein [Tanacetum cinerariifolium]